MGLYQGFGHTVTSQSPIFIANIYEAILNNIPEEEENLLVRGPDSSHDILKKQQKLLDSGQHIPINIQEEQKKLDLDQLTTIYIPKEQMEIPNQSYYRYHIQTVTSQALFSAEPSEDSMIDIWESRNHFRSCLQQFPNLHPRYDLFKWNSATVDIVLVETALTG